MTQRPLRLLYLVESLGRGGANQTTLTVAVEMKRRGHFVVFCSEGGPLRHQLEDEGIPHVEVRTAGRHPSVSLARHLAATIRTQHIDLVCPNGFDCTLSAVPAALLTGRPVFPTYGGMFVPPYPHPWLPVVNVFAQEFVESFVGSHGWDRRECRNIVARVDGRRFHPGVSGEALRAELGLAADQPAVVVVCRLDRLKMRGAEVVLEAAPQVHRAHPGVKVVVFGEGSGLAEMQARAGALNGAAGTDFVLLPGATSRTPEAFALADLVIGNGARSTIEAMACGKPVVSVGANGFCGVITPRSVESFRRFNFYKGSFRENPYGEASHLADTVSRLLRSPALRGDLGAFGREYACQHLLVEGGCEEYERSYREAIACGGRLRTRVKVAWRWMGAAAGFGWHRLAARLSPARRAWRDRPVDPPAGLDPDWQSGLLAEADPPAGSSSAG